MGRYLYLPLMTEGPTEMKSSSKWNIYLESIEVLSFSSSSRWYPTLFKISVICSLLASFQRMVAPPFHQLSKNNLTMMQWFLAQLGILESYQILFG